MYHKKLHDLAKFGAGLILGDFISIVWIYINNLLPIPFMGVTFTSEMVIPSLVFDFALFLALIHYGWNIGKIPAMRERTYLLFAGVIFTIVSAAHILRVLFNADLVLMDLSVPLWLSWIGTLVTAYLAYMSFHLALKMKR